MLHEPYVRAVADLLGAALAEPALVTTTSGAVAVNA